MFLALSIPIPVENTLLILSAALKFGYTFMNCLGNIISDLTRPWSHPHAFCYVAAQSLCLELMGRQEQNHPKEPQKGSCDSNLLEWMFRWVPAFPVSSSRRCWCLLFVTLVYHLAQGRINIPAIKLRWNSRPSNVYKTKWNKTKQQQQNQTCVLILFIDHFTIYSANVGTQKK